MDADAIKILEATLSGTSELPTLLAMREAVELRISQVQVVRASAYLVDGWLPNPPGLTCNVCGADTMSKLYPGRGIEQVRCMDVLCGHMREVVVS